MASVRKLDPNDPKSPWVVEYTDAAGKRRRKTPKSGLKKDAQDIAREIARELHDGTHVARTQTVNVAQLAKLYLDDLCKRADYGHVTRSTLATYKSNCDRVVKLVGSRLLTDVEQALAQRFIDDLATRYNAVTVKHTFAHFYRMLEYAVVAKVLKVNPVRMSRLHLPKSERRAKIPSRAELQKIIAASLVRKKYEQEPARIMRHAMFCLALFSTLRRGEVAGLRWCDVDFTKGAINIRQSRTSRDGVKGPKTAAGVRTVPMPRILADALLAIPEPRGEYVFTRTNGKLPNPGNLHLYWYYLSEKAGLSLPREPGKRFGSPIYRFHDMRHAAASLLIAHGANPLHVQRAMGHARIETTLGIYGHLFDNDDTVRATSLAVADAFSATKTRHAPVVEHKSIEITR